MLGGGGSGGSTRHGASFQRATEALTAAERGFGRVHLLAPRSKKSKYCGWNCTDPHCSGRCTHTPRHAGHVHATADAAELAQRFASDPDANYSTIPAAGLFVLDPDGGTVPFELPPTVTANTGGADEHRHLWFTLPAELRGWTVRGKAGVLDGVDIIGSTGSPQYAVGVGSIHPDTGRTYTWAPGLSPNDVHIATAPPPLVAFLQTHGLLVQPSGQASAANATSTPHRSGNQPAALGNSNSKPRKHPADTFAAITSAAMARNGKRHGAEITFCCPFHNDTHPSCCWNTDKHVFRCYGASCKTEGGWKKLARALNVPFADTFAQARGLVAELADLAHRTRWPGVAGATQRDVLLAVLTIAAECGRHVFSASTRQIADRAGVSRKPTERALYELRAAGWLERPEVGTERMASTFRLRRPMRHPDPTIRKADRLVGSTCRIDDDAFRWRGLGKTARPVLTALERGPWASARALALAHGLNPRTVERVLRRLEGHGLAARTPAGWQIGPAELDAVRPTLRSHGATARQKAVHAAERQAYRTRPRRGRLVAVERVLHELTAAPEARDEKRPPGRGPRENERTRARQSDEHGPERPRALTRNEGEQTCSRAHAPTPASGC